MGRYKAVPRVCKEDVLKSPFGSVELFILGLSCVLPRFVKEGTLKQPIGSAELLNLQGPLYGLLGSRLYYLVATYCG